MPVIYNYFDIHQYLHDDFSERQKRNPRYSLRAMAERLGLNSGTVVRIMSGKRNISKNLLPVFISYLSLRPRESEYFSNLVNLCQAKTEKMRSESYQQLVLLRGRRTQVIEQRCYSFYEEWYYSAVREILRLHKFDGNYKNLAFMLDPQITVHEAKKAVEILMSLGLVDNDKSGYSVREQSITTGEKWQGSAITQFQKITLQRAIEAIDRYKKEERDFSTMTMCYSPEGLQKVKEVLKRTRDELSRIEESDNEKDRVYQVNFQVFPLSATIQKDEK